MWALARMGFNDNFLSQYKEELMQLPVPDIARQYYCSNENQYLLNLFCTVKGVDKDTRCDITLNTLYDVFVCIRNDEREHWKTLCNLVQYDQMYHPNNMINDGVQSTRPK